MVEEKRDSINIIQISSIDEQQQQEHHSQSIPETNLSTISFENSNIPSIVLDVFNEIYSNRTHQKCIYISYYTLLSMTLAVIFWICHWLTYNRCQNLKDPQLNIFLCDLAIIFKIL